MAGGARYRNAAVGAAVSIAALTGFCIAYQDSSGSFSFYGDCSALNVRALTARLLGYQSNAAEQRKFA